MLRVVVLATCGLAACSSATPQVAGDGIVRLVAAPITVPQPPNPTGAIDIATFGASDVWVARYDCARRPAVEIAESIDAGVTWLPRGAPAIDCSDSGVPAVSSVEMRFVDALHGVIALPSDANSTLGRLFVTADAGRTWTTGDTPGHLSDLVTVSGRLWASIAANCLGPISCPTHVASSDDQGRTWSVATGSIPEPDAQILPLSASVLLAAATQVWRSTDAGTSWHQLASPCPTGVPRRESRTVRLQLAGGPRGLWAACEIVVLPTAYVDPIQTLIYRSHDGGATWQETLSAIPARYWPVVTAAPARSISAPDANTAWLSLSEATGPASSNHPEVVATVDGGRSWHVVFASTVPVQASRVQNFLVSFADAHHGWVAGLDTYATQDGGMHWTRRSLPWTEPG